MAATFKAVKDPNAVTDFQIDWTDWLNGDTISTSTWTVETGITQDSESETTAITTIWLSGGTAGVTYTVTNRIVTAAGRTDDRSIAVRVVDR